MAAILFIFPAKASSVVSGFLLLTGRAVPLFFSPVLVKYGRDRNAETKTKIEGQMSSFNILRKRQTKNGNDYQNSLSKVVGKQKTKTDGSNSIFNVVGKRKTNSVFR